MALNVARRRPRCPVELLQGAFEGAFSILFQMAIVFYAPITLSAKQSMVAYLRVRPRDLDLDSVTTHLATPFLRKEISSKRLSSSARGMSANTIIPPSRGTF